MATKKTTKKTTKATTEKPQVEETVGDKLQWKLKEEELLSLYIANMRGQNRDAETIKQGWLQIKPTITPDNIDDYTNIERLKALVLHNRHVLGYESSQIAKMLEMALKEARG